MGSSAFEVFAPYVGAAGLLLAFSSLKSWRIHDRNVDRLFAFLFVAAAAAIAGSLDLGTDAPAYRDYYLELLNLPAHYGWWDPGFETLALAFAKVGAPYGLFVCVNVLVSHLIKLYVYDKISTNLLLALFVLFCLNLGEVAYVRQYLAASIILLSFYLLANKRIVWAILSIIAASLIHKSALVAAIIVILVYFGWSALKPLAVLLVGALALVAALPSNITTALVQRILAQVAVYTAQGYVQGFETEDISLARNVLKFGLYVVIALWMISLPRRTRSDEIQNKSGHIVLGISAVSIGLILVSPVFSRLSVYVFPFLALSVRVERFAPRYSQVFGQCAVVLMLVINLVVSMYPLVAFL
jgi:hypothetical protein